MSYIEKSIMIFLIANIVMTLFNILITICIIGKLNLDEGRKKINERDKKAVEKL